MEKFTYEEILSSDKMSLNIILIKDKLLATLNNLPELDLLAVDIIENLKAGLASFKAVLGKLAVNKILTAN